MQPAIVAPLPPPKKHASKHPLKVLVLGSHAMYFIRRVAELTNPDAGRQLFMDAHYAVPERGKLVFSSVSACIEYRPLLFGDIDRANVVMYTYSQRDIDFLTAMRVHMQLVTAQSHTLPVVFVAVDGEDRHATLSAEITKQIGQICFELMVSWHGPFIFRHVSDAERIAAECFVAMDESILHTYYPKPPEKVSSARAGPVEDADGDGDVVVPSKSGSSSAPSTPRGGCDVQ